MYGAYIYIYIYVCMLNIPQLLIRGLHCSSGTWKFRVSLGILGGLRSGHFGKGRGVGCLEVHEAHKLVAAESFFRV